MHAKLDHFIDLENISASLLHTLFDRADEYIAAGQHRFPQLELLRQKTIANVFFEPSTRTRCSFELAAQRLGAHVLNFDIATSSMNKGEALLDTLHNLEAMHIDLFILRHQDNLAIYFIKENLKSHACLINAGSGTHAHPTQALLDMLTIRQHKKDFANLNIAIVGDIAHSRVARSNIHALKILGANEIRVIAPKQFLDAHVNKMGVVICEEMDKALENIDVIILLRIQKERMFSEEIPDARHYFQQYGLTQKRLALAKPDAIVMHPGPINREVDIASEVADGKQSVILQQVSNGVAARMAIMTELLIYPRSVKGS